MKHPGSRAARRFTRECWRNRRRQQCVNWWTRRVSAYELQRGVSNRVDAAQLNRVWWQGGKQCTAHGNRCMCHYVKCREFVDRRRRVRGQAESTAELRRRDKAI